MCLVGKQAKHFRKPLVKDSVEGALHNLENDDKSSAREAHMTRSLDRLLSLIAVLGLACLGIGLALLLIGWTLDNLFVSQVGADTLVIGGVLVGIRVLEWIAEEIVGLGLKSMTKEN